MKINGELTKAIKVLANLRVEDLLYLVDSKLVCKRKTSEQMVRRKQTSIFSCERRRKKKKIVKNVSHGWLS